MAACGPRPFDESRTAFLDRLVRRMEDGEVDEPTRRAVSVLTADADPGHADRLAVEPGEDVALVERLAVWALRRAGDRAVTAAGRILDGDAPGRDAAGADADLALVR